MLKGLSTTLPGANSKEKARYLLNRPGVACVPGSAFYHNTSGKDLLLFCFAKNDDVIEEACARIINLNI